MPPFQDELAVHGLKVGNGAVDQAFRRHGGYVTVEILQRSCAVEVIEAI